MGRKRSIAYVTALFLLLCLIAFSLCFKQYIKAEKFISGGLASANAVTLISRNESKISFDELKELSREYSKVTFYVKEPSQSTLSVIRVYGNTKNKDISRLIDGRYFDNKDMNSSVAVIGENVRNSPFYDREYFVWDKKYFVIGSIKSDISHMLGDTVFINLDSSTEIKKIQIDADNVTDIAMAAAQIQRQFGYEEISEDSNIIDRYLWENQDITVNAVYAFILLGYIAIISFVMISFKEECTVMLVIGFSTRHIWFCVVGTIVRRSLCAICTFFLASIFVIPVLPWLPIAELFLSLVLFSLGMIGGIAIILIPFIYFVRRLWTA